MKRCIVVGSAGQDGSILFDRLASEGKFVVGIAQGAARSSDGSSRAAVDITAPAAVEELVSDVHPDAVFYLAAYHHSAEQKLDEPAELFRRSFAIQVGGALNFLEAIRRRSPATRFFYASTGRIFGMPSIIPQDETTPVDPDCAYGISKAAGQRCVRYYRQAHALFAATGILFNHESPRRRPTFVTRKIVQAAVAIKRGARSKLTLGDLATIVDWGYAPDYVEAMIRIMELDEADDFVVATGEPHSVREFVDTAFGLVGLDWRTHVDVAPSLLGRPRRSLIGNAAKLRSATGWRPSVSFTEMIRLLVEAEEAGRETA